MSRSLIMSPAMSAPYGAASKHTSTFTQVKFLYNSGRGTLTIRGIAHYAKISIRRVKVLIAQIESIKHTKV